MENFLDLNLDEISEVLKRMGEPAFRAKQILRGYYNTLDFRKITDVPKTLREKLAAIYSVPIRIVRQADSKIDETKKFLYELSDGNLIEGVLMRYRHGYTLCVSTQVGCRMGCKFCASTKGGLIRNLTAGEILGQVLIVNLHLGGKIDARTVTNLVLMGSGEPLDNYVNTVKFLRLVTAKEGICISPRNITLSTCGLVPEMRRLVSDGVGVNLSVSLHAPTEEARRSIMPIAEKYSIREVVNAANYYGTQTDRRVTFEYALVSGVNSGETDAKRLSEVVKNVFCHINVIPINPIRDADMNAPEKRQAYAFVAMLEKLGVSATLRRQLGADIDGACGQLRSKFLEDTSLPLAHKAEE